ncbi:hypothetical protein E7T09_15990 [Deinococcus sp. KSM4-11]|uniref:glycosyl hydrolase 2 galactose-binding domain-containing protein n=1 Tax=Deinococcus sp. KSM4-11 TaxID=2568654 RepID=UPI0010A43A9C|nr:glycoside hydrolase family 2 protein [Deinococcus sp. KSM4-11]THF85463.1 hypothetical protein E7T09_15990 [Deinococcus sp. KSM4-11]
MTSPPPDDRFRQDLGDGWEVTASIDEGWRFRGLERGTPQPVGAFARTRWYPARVPGSVHADLLHAGVIPDFRQGTNSLAAEWVSARQWVYRRTFRVALPPGGRLWLRLDGVDWAASIYVNGERLGCVEGAYTVTRLLLPDLDRAAEHLLVVVLDAPPDELGQLGRTSETRTLKARYGYWWDFGTRLIQVGLWQPVALERDEGQTLLDVVPQATLSADFTRAQVRAEIAHDGAAGAPLRITLTHPDGREDTQTAPVEDVVFDLDGPQLWWPWLLGDQPLYRLRAELEGSAPVTCRFGLRDVQLVHNAASSARGALPYTLQVNGVPIYARGFNVLPVDMTAGLPHEESRQRAVIELARRAHATVLRFNGVAPLAPKSMLDACDDLGLLVWQELPLSSSTADSVPPALDTVRAALDAGLPPLLRRLRAHPCVALVDAGNELTDGQRRPVSLENPTVAHMLAHVRRAGLTQPVLPTSPSGPTYDLDETVALTRPENQHDVHGPWHYRGAADSYRPHALSRALLHSEFGCQAPPRERTLRRALPDSPLWPMDDTRPEVVHHGEWWLMRHRVEEVFGSLAGLRPYLLLAQAVQGDVLRHALAWNRSRSGECSGALVWQLNEPWPGAHNTSVLDHDLAPKLAYYRCRETNAPTALHWGMEAPVAADTLILRPHVLADTPGAGRVEVAAFDLQGERFWTTALDAAWPGSLPDIAVPLPPEPALLRGRVLDAAGTVLANSEVWVAREQPTPFAALVQLPLGQLTLMAGAGRVILTNIGPSPLPWLSLEAEEEGVETFEDNGFTLLPGESRRVTVALHSLSGKPISLTLTAQAVNLLPVSVVVEP